MLLRIRHGILQGGMQEDLLGKRPVTPVSGFLRHFFQLSFPAINLNTLKKEEGRKRGKIKSQKPRRLQSTTPRPVAVAVLLSVFPFSLKLSFFVSLLQFENVGCPDPMMLPAQGFSSCTMRAQCNAGAPDNATQLACCQDAGGHRQCVDPATKAPPEGGPDGAEQLGKSCGLTVGPDGERPGLLRRPENETCRGPDDPEAPFAGCDRRETLCCEGRCWGLPLPKKRPRDDDQGECGDGYL